MTIEEIRSLISESEYDYIGIRADNRDYQIGKVMDNSHQLFQDPEYTDSECTELLYPYISRLLCWILRWWRTRWHMCT